MKDSISFAVGQSIQAQSGAWYRNLQRLGSGGNATAYLVIATSGPYRGVSFALKIFRRLSKPERRDSFIEEMNFLQGCNHPCVMRVFDAGVFYGEHPFFVAEFLPRTLHQVIRAESGWAWRCHFKRFEPNGYHGSRGSAERRPAFERLGGNI